MKRSGRARRTHRPVLAAGVAVATALLLGLAANAAENFRLPGLDGGQLTGADLARGDVVVVVWASWSPRCRDIAERVNALTRGWGNKARIVTVDFQEEPAAVREFLRDKKLSAPVFLDRDGEFSKAHAVTTLPGLVVFRDGTARYQGKLPTDPDATLHQAFD